MTRSIVPLDEIRRHLDADTIVALTRRIARLEEALREVMANGHDCTRLGGGDAEQCTTCLKARAALEGEP